mmetsp:Transcript_8935/g.37520  ORF Transcript_8935/g.37520 Transcript_8935/m.37520 type:complete len:475 (-) Transcript_8935:2378-3802(-)
MRRALVVARRTFRVPRCLRTCVRRVGGGCFTREVFREQDASATDASATDATATDATDATATAEAVTEGKRPRPDADSVPVEQPDADAVSSGRARRRVHVFPTPLTAFAACLRVTAVRLRRDAQQPTPDAEALFGPEALFHEAFERFREAADAARETRVRADEAVGLVENAGNALGLGMTIDQLRKNEKDAAEKTADNARAANIAANAASVCQRTAKDFDHVAHQRAAVADVAAAAARERLAVPGGSGIAAGVLETVASANQARAVAQRARKLSNHAVNVLNATLADSAAADAQRQRAAALAADAAANTAADAAAEYTSARYARAFSVSFAYRESLSPASQAGLVAASSLCVWKNAGPKNRSSASRGDAGSSVSAVSESFSMTHTSWSTNFSAHRSARAVSRGGAGNGGALGTRRDLNEKELFFAVDGENVAPSRRRFFSTPSSESASAKEESDDSSSEIGSRTSAVAPLLKDAA